MENSKYFIENEYHYQIIERAITFIHANIDQKISLEILGSEVGLSSLHFQKIFSKWAGISPKQYHQYLKLNHAKTMLENRHSLLETSVEMGMSSASRLHDLFIKWEAMSPGSYAKKGAGLTIYTGVFNSPFGKLIAMGTKKGLCGLGFANTSNENDAVNDLKQRWPNAKYKENTSLLSSWVEAALKQKGQTNLYLMGAPFQLKVWEALLHIPLGHVTTYSDIAQKIGHPKAVRAVGTAVGKNPISMLIPCHRVLRKSGELGGYHWGLPIKRSLLAWETGKLD